MIKSLTCDIKRRIYMLYAPRQRCPQSRTAQPGPHLVARTRAPARGRRSPCPDLLHLATAGLSLSRPGAATQTAGPGRRCQGILHRQAFAELGRQAPCVCRFDRADLERGRQPRSVGGAASRGRTWLTGHQVGNGRCGWNMHLIGCCRRNWPTRMSCSCPTRCGPPPEPVVANMPAVRRF